MTERIYRLIVGILLVFALYFDIEKLIYVLIGVFLFEGITNVFIIKTIMKGFGSPLDATEGECILDQKYRINFGAERSFRLIFVAILLISMLFNNQLWFLPWFMGFAVFGAGLSGICPMIIALKWMGFKCNIYYDKKESCGIQGSLPVKITGIVFWGMILVGVVSTVLILRDFENRLTERYKNNSDYFALHLSQILHDNPEYDSEELKEKIRELIGKLKLNAVEVILGDRIIAVGEKSHEMIAHKNYLEVPDIDLKPKEVGITIYYPNIKETISKDKKNILILIAVVLILFGFVLISVLRNILTKPFQQMVETAKSFSDGNDDQRFDVTRSDEFGYFSKFINDIIDKLIAQRNKLQRSEVELFQAKELAEITLHSIGDGVITTDAHGKIEYMNPVAEKLTNYLKNEARGKMLAEIAELINENTREKIEDPISQCLVTGSIVHLPEHTLLIRHDGEEIPIADSVAPIKDRSGNTIGSVIVFHDVEQTRKLSRELTYQATHDALTGLYNRREFEERLRQALKEAFEEDKKHAVCYMDLDQFKIVNDTCGHIAGDELLRQVSSLLKEHIRESDMLARLGGDEFGLLLRYCHPDFSFKIAEKILNKVRDFRFIWEDHSFEIGMSIGLVVITEEDKKFTDVLSEADVSCYAAKDSGRNRIHVYKEDDAELARRRGEMHWITRIRKAINEDRFLLRCQKIVPLSMHNNGKAQIEILLSMIGENNELIAPMNFIPAAERYNIMSEVDQWVIRNALRALSEKKLFNHISKCLINISGQTICDEKFVDFVVGELAKFDIKADCLCFEITETAAVANLVKASRAISLLKNIGCYFSLDDFGCGMSSFRYLKNLNVNYVKIDGSFVKEISDNHVSRAIVKSINQVTHTMGMLTVAESVENKDVLKLLVDMGVDYAQGYCIDIPRPLDDFQSQDLHIDKILD